MHQGGSFVWNIGGHGHRNGGTAGPNLSKTNMEMGSVDAAAQGGALLGGRSLRDPCAPVLPSTLLLLDPGRRPPRCWGQGSCWKKKQWWVVLAWKKVAPPPPVGGGLWGGGLMNLNGCFVKFLMCISVNLGRVFSLPGSTKCSFLLLFFRFL